jgi:hypothetical protein
LCAAHFFSSLVAPVRLPLFQGIPLAAAGDRYSLSPWSFSSLVRTTSKASTRRPSLADRRPLIGVDPPRPLLRREAVFDPKPIFLSDIISKQLGGTRSFFLSQDLGSRQVLGRPSSKQLRCLNRLTAGCSQSCHPRRHKFRHLWMLTALSLRPTLTLDHFALGTVLLD